MFNRCKCCGEYFSLDWRDNFRLRTDEEKELEGETDYCSESCAMEGCLNE